MKTFMCFLTHTHSFNPVKRAIQKYVLNDLSKQLIAGTVRNNEAITVDFDGEKLVYQN